MLSIVKAAANGTLGEPPRDDGTAAHRKTSRVLWLKLNFTVKAARLQTLKRHKYQHLQEEALLKARGLLKNWENGVVVLTEDLYRRAAGERDAQELMNYTPEALALRFSLRNDPRVLEAVRQLWQVEMQRDSLGCIDQRGYASVFCRVAKSLDAKAFKKKQKVDRLLDEDWKRDTKGEPTMSFASFFDSIFELADLWCETIDAEDYVYFLNRLRDRISHVRNGKRVLKLLPKVTAFDANSEEEEDESDSCSSDEQEKTPVAPQATAAPRFLVAKSILPVAQPQLKQQQQQQQQQANRFKKATQVAINSKTINRKSVVPVAEAPKGRSSTEKKPPGQQETTVSTDVVVPRHQQQQPPQRRASVVTTIQFLDDGLVWSVSESIADATRSNSSASAAPPALPSSSGTPPVAADALAATASKRGQKMRPSLAAVAAAALGHTDEDSTTGAVRNSMSNERQDHSNKHPQEEIPRAGRRSVVPVSTTKRAVLKSIVFTKSSNKPATESGSGLDGNQTEPVPISAESSTLDTSMQSTEPTSIESTQTQQQQNRHTGTGPRTAAANGVALRMRTGSLFMMGTDQSKRSTTAKPIRHALNRGGGQLAPLSSANATPASVAVTVARLNGTNQAQSESDVNTSSSANALDASASTPVLSSAFTPEFSGSVVTTSYAVTRTQQAVPMRSVNAIGSVKKPPPATANGTATQPRGYIVGTKALARDLPATPVHAPIAESQPATKNPAIAIVQKPPEDAGISDRKQPRGHALHGTGDHFRRPLAPIDTDPLGLPERALRIRAALDPEYPQVSRGERQAPQSRQPVYNHTETVDDTASIQPVYSEPGMTIQSFPGPHKARVSPLKPMRSPPKPVPIDPTATPCDTSDDEDIAGGLCNSEPNLLQPENARDGLAKVRIKREASLSARSARDVDKTRPRSTSSACSTRPRSRSGCFVATPTDGDYSDSDENEDGIKAYRARILTVASLGGKSTTVARKESRQYSKASSSDDESEPGMRSAISAPVLPTITQLELDYSQQTQSPKRRAKNLEAHREMPPTRIPVGVRRRPETPDGLMLQGELAMGPSRSLPRSPPRTSPRRIGVCTCQSESAEPSVGDSDAAGQQPAVYQLDPSAKQSGTCPTCAAAMAATRETEATLIINATREVVLQPLQNEPAVNVGSSQDLPTRSQMMRRRHRYTHGRPM